MKVMIFVVGCGECMCLLIDICFKLFLKVCGCLLIVWQIFLLVCVGIIEIVINYVYLGQMIEDIFGDGSCYGVKFFYLFEMIVLEMVGGIVWVCYLLGEEFFIVVFGDIWCLYFDYSELLIVLEDEDLWGNLLLYDKCDLVWLYLVKNLFFYFEGDFVLSNFVIVNEGQFKLIFVNIGVYCFEMFDGIVFGSYVKLGLLLCQYVD